jgi:cysteine-rich CPXCG protein
LPNANWNKQMLSTTTTHISCPYCGETFELVVDPSETSQSYIEDCYVCCRPIHLDVTVDVEGDVMVIARDENEC